MTTANKNEKVITPPVISFTSFTTFLNQLRETGAVPSRIDKTLMPKASGSQQAGTLAALRYFGLIDDNGKPVEYLKKLVLAQDDERKTLMAAIIQKSYGFLFENPDFDLKNATSGEMTERFREFGISGSTITKTIAFFLAASKESGIPVSQHIKAPPAPKTNGQSKKSPAKGKDDEKRGDRKTEINETDDDDPKWERFEIPIPGKSSVRVLVPADLDADDWEMLQQMITAYIKRWKGFST